MDEKDVTIDELKAAGDPYYFFWVGLNRLYKEFGGTQVQFANRIGLAQSYVSRVLAGTKILKRATIPKVCKSLGMSFDAIAAEGGAGACDLPPASGASPRNKLIRLMGKRPVIDEDAPPKSSLTVAEMFPDPPYLQFIASGEASWYLSGKAPVLFDPNWAMSIGASGNLAVFRVEDDFMEPVASAGDFALVDLSATRPAHDKVYVLFLKGGRFLSLARFKRSGPPGALTNKNSEGYFETCANQLDFNEEAKEFYDIVGRAVMVVRPIE